MIRPSLLFVTALVSCRTVHAQESAPGNQLSALPWLKLDSLSATRERPLFAPSRRRAPPQPLAVNLEIPKDQRAKAPEIELTGLIEGNDITIVFLRTGSQTVVVRSGDKYGRWQVVADSKTSVKLINGEKQIRLEMFATP
ncbi:MAG: hypothetical protein WBX25_17810 [Rhodomicrobium sp.]